MFLRLSVILFTEGSLFRGYLSRGSLSREVSVKEGVSVQGGLCPGRVSVKEGSLSREVSVRETAQVQLHAGGTHPTGMHSC